MSTQEETRAAAAVGVLNLIELRGGDGTGLSEEGVRVLGLVFKVAGGKQGIGGVYGGATGKGGEKTHLIWSEKWQGEFVGISGMSVLKYNRAEVNSQMSAEELARCCEVGWVGFEEVTELRETCKESMAMHEAMMETVYGERRKITFEKLVGEARGWVEERDRGKHPVEKENEGSEGGQEDPVKRENPGVKADEEVAAGMREQRRERNKKRDGRGASSEDGEEEVVEIGGGSVDITPREKRKDKATGGVGMKPGDQATSGERNEAKKDEKKKKKKDKSRKKASEEKVEGEKGKEEVEGEKGGEDETVKEDEKKKKERMEEEEKKVRKEEKKLRKRVMRAEEKRARKAREDEVEARLAEAERAEAEAAVRRDAARKAIKKEKKRKFRKAWKASKRMKRARRGEGGGGDSDSDSGSISSSSSRDSGGSSSSNSSDGSDSSSGSGSGSDSDSSEGSDTGTGGSGGSSSDSEGGDGGRGSGFGRGRKGSKGKKEKKKRKGKKVKGGGHRGGSGGRKRKLEGAFRREVAAAKLKQGNGTVIAKLHGDLKYAHDCAWPSVEVVKSMLGTHSSFQAWAKVYKREIRDEEGWAKMFFEGEPAEGGRVTGSEWHRKLVLLMKVPNRVFQKFNSLENTMVPSQFYAARTVVIRQIAAKVAVEFRCPHKEKDAGLVAYVTAFVQGDWSKLDAVNMVDKLCEGTRVAQYRLPARAREMVGGVRMFGGTHEVMEKMLRVLMPVMAIASGSLLKHVEKFWSRGVEMVKCATTENTIAEVRDLFEAMALDWEQREREEVVRGDGGAGAKARSWGWKIRDKNTWLTQASKKQWDRLGKSLVEVERVADSGVVAELVRMELARATTSVQLPVVRQGQSQRQGQLQKRCILRLGTPPPSVSAIGEQETKDLKAEWRKENPNLCPAGRLFEGNCLYKTCFQAASHTTPLPVLLPEAERMKVWRAAFGDSVVVN